MAFVEKFVLILCQNYPSEHLPHSQAFIHTRLKNYPKNFNLKVISFSAQEDYTLDGVEVYTERSFLKKFPSKEIELLISHAPNLRNHFRFIIQNFHSFHKILFFFHGYEIIDVDKRVYQQKTHLTFIDQPSSFFRFYQKAKLPLLRVLFLALKTMKFCRFVFVSKTLVNETNEDLKSGIFKNDLNFDIIHNAISEDYQKLLHTPDKVQHDFICIRPFNDPKYGVDIFIKLAENNPRYSFHLYGKGSLPKVEKLPSNLSVFEKFLLPQELPVVLCRYRAAILPTRWDSQGVLACEAATLGMPVITSDLPVCREILNRFENVVFEPNEKFHELDLSKFNISSKKITDYPFELKKTVDAEINLINKILNF